jgi:enterochelin esterase-like enzyme
MFLAPAQQITRPTSKRLRSAATCSIIALVICAAAAVTAQDEPKQAKKARGKKDGADAAPVWVWRNPQTPAGTQLKTFKSATLKGEEVSYLFWPPPGYDAQDTAKRYPVAYFLHGGGGNYTHIPEAFLPQAAEAIKAGTLPPFLGIVVNGLPSSFFVDSQDGKSPVDSIVIQDLLPHVDATYPTSGVRLIEGFSMGGRGATYFAFKYPDKFRGLADFSGAIHDWGFFSRMQVVAQLFPDEMAFEKAWPFTLVRRNTAAIQSNFPAGIFIAVGDKDTGRGNTYEWNVKLHNTLDELKIANELCVVKDVRHSYQLLAADPELAKRHLAYYAAVFQAKP